jgi:O-antigen ligase
MRSENYPFVAPAQGSAGADSVPRPTWRDWVGPGICGLLVFAGQFKRSPLLSWLPIDLTLLAAAVMLIALMMILAARGPNLRVSPWAFALIAALVPGWAMLDLANEYQIKKLLGMGITLLAACGATYLIDSPSKQRKWTHVLVAIASVYALAVLIAPADQTVAGALTLEGSNTTAAGQVAGVAFVVLFTRALLNEGGRRILLVASSLVFLAFLIASGSRGAFLATILAVVAVGLIRAKGRPGRIAILLVGAMSVYVILSRLGNAGAARIASSLFGSADATLTRDPLWKDAWNAVLSDPVRLIGVGWGNFGSVRQMGLVDQQSRQYAHNVILEIWVEGGVVALIAICAFIIASLLRLARGWRTVEGTILFGIGIFALVNASLSGDVNDNRLMWVSLTLAWVSAASSPRIRPAGVTPQPAPQSPLRQDR